MSILVTIILLFVLWAFAGLLDAYEVMEAAGGVLRGNVADESGEE
jgi:hypothetical protein